MTENSLNKTEKLKSRKSIEYLFRSGKTITSPPFRLLYRTVEESDAPVKMAVAVPKRLIRKAVNRNLLKRRTREAYRQSKHGLYAYMDAANQKLEIVLLFQSSEIVDYTTINKSITLLLGRLVEKLKHTSSF